MRDLPIKFLWQAFLILCAPALSFSFYNLAGGLPYRYEAKFEGSVIVRNSYKVQTNSKASFSFDFSIALNEETEKIAEQVVSWEVGPIQKDSTLPLFANLWGEAWRYATNSLAYSIMLPSDNILTISKDGGRSPIGMMLEAILPAVNFKQYSKVEQYAFPFTNSVGQSKNIEIRMAAWDFFGQEPPDDADPILFITGRDEIIGKIFKAYEEKNKLKQPALFWMQNTTVFSGTPYGIKQEVLNVTGVYQIDISRRMLERSHALAKATIPVPLRSKSSLSSWVIEIDGIFIMEEKQ